MAWIKNKGKKKFRYYLFKKPIDRIRARARYSILAAHPGLDTKDMDRYSKYGRRISNNAPMTIYRKGKFVKGYRYKLLKKFTKNVRTNIRGRKLTQAKFRSNKNYKNYRSAQGGLRHIQASLIRDGHRYRYHSHPTKTNKRRSVYWKQAYYRKSILRKEKYADYLDKKYAFSSSSSSSNSSPFKRK